MTLATEVVLASTPQDAHAVEAVRRHHAELAGGLTARVDALLLVADAGDCGDRLAVVRDDLIAFCRNELLPHALGEETTVYRAATRLPELRLLVGVMISEHAALRALVDETAAGSAVRAAAAARALVALLEPHLAAENDVLLPRLAADPDVSLAQLVEELHEDVVRHRTVDDEQADPAPHGTCGCGGTDDAVPELDARAIPHAIRHASVFGAFDAVPVGGSLVLVTPHDPVPLLRQLAERAGGRLDVEYLERGPEAWRLRLTR